MFIIATSTSIIIIIINHIINGITIITSTTITIAIIIIINDIIIIIIAIHCSPRWQPRVFTVQALRAAAVYHMHGTGTWHNAVQYDTTARFRPTVCGMIPYNNYAIL